MHKEEIQEHYDVVVIGAGISGIAACRTYLQANPHVSLTVLDSNSSLGGVWSDERLYPGLKTNNWYGSYEYSDYRMENVAPPADAAIDGTTVNKYFKAYATEYDLHRYIQFNTLVTSIEQINDNGWLLNVQAHGAARQLFASKLIVATGTTSEAMMPTFKGQETFEPPIYHSKDFGMNHANIQAPTSVTVFSGSKSAFDVAYAYASQGVQVEWIIRKSGQGPNWMSPPRISKFKFAVAYIIFFRIMSWFSPCIWSDYSGFSWIRNFLNQTSIGRRMVRGVFGKMEHGCAEINKYDVHPETKKLKPWHDLIWIGTTRGLLNYDGDIFQLVRDGKIRVHVADVDRLQGRTVYLENGDKFDTDVIICATGWKTAPPFSFTKNGKDIVADLGLPHTASLDKNRVPTADDKLLETVDAEILTRFPILKGQSPPSSVMGRVIADKDGQISVANGYQLYRFMVPPKYIHSRNIAFMGFYRSIHVPIIAQAQALWITAYFNNKLESLAALDSADQLVVQRTEQRIQYETVLHNRWGKWRFPHGWGSQFPDFFFDGLPLADMYIHDLGLNQFRKVARSSWGRAIGWINELIETYKPCDYKTIVQEWQSRYAGANNKGVQPRNSSNHVMKTDELETKGMNMHTQPITSM